MFALPKFIVAEVIEKIASALSREIREFIVDDVLPKLRKIAAGTKNEVDDALVAGLEEILGVKHP